MSSLLLMMHASHVLAAGLLLGLAVHGMKRTKHRPLRALTAFCFFSGWWALFSAVIFYVPDLETKILLNRVKLLAPTFIPLTILSLTFALTGRRPWHRWARILFCIVPAITSVLLVMPRLHEAFIGQYRILPFGNQELLAFSNGPWFKAHIFNAQLIVLLSISLLLLLRRDLNGPHRYRVWLVIIAIAAPFIADALAVHFVEELRFVQVVPTLLLVSACFMLYAVMRHHFINVVPFARGAILNSTDDLYLVFDTERHLVDFNAKAEEMLALTRADIGTSFSVLTSARQSMASLQDLEPHQTREWNLGDEIFEVGCRFLRDPIADHIGTVLAFKNVTVRRKNEIELEHLNQIKAKILAVIGHDFQGNLAASLVTAQTLVRRGDGMHPDEVKKAHENLQKMASDNVALIEDLLAWSKYRMDVPSAWESIQLDKLVARVIDFLSPQSQERGIKIEASSDGPITLKTDTTALTTIVRNLLSNALKFTPANGQVIVHTRSTEDAIELVVEDNGHGIEPKRQKTLFDISKSESGGIGLFICREFVTRLGGEIWLQSESGSGSRFYVRLPR